MALVKAKDLAKKIGVSTATISLVLNGKAGISDKTRRNVEDQIRKLGYGYLLQKNPTGGNSIKLKTDQKVEGSSLGFILFQRTGELLEMNSFFPLIMGGIESAAREAGYALSVIKITAENVNDQIHYITDAKCAGVVVFATEMHEEDMAAFLTLGLPLVIFDNEFYGYNANFTKVNNSQGTYLLVKHLVKNGHKRIGYLSSNQEIDSFAEREMFAFRAMDVLGIKKENQFRFNLGYPHEKARLEMTKILKEKRKEELPTAFLGDNDLVVIGAMQAALEGGYNIPNDFSFVGYDDRPECTIISPKLTTIQLPRELFGAASIRQLLQVMRGNMDGSITQEVNGILIERESVAALSDLDVVGQLETNENL